MIRAMLMLSLAAVCAVTAALGVYQYISMTPETQVRDVDQEDVVVLRVDVTRVGTELTEDMLQLVQRPLGSTHEGALHEISAAVGQSVVIPMFRGEPIIQSKLGKGTGLAALVPEGMLAFTFQAPSESSLMAGFAMPNDRVDILLTRDDPSKQRGGKVTQRLVQNVRILAAGVEINRPAGNRVEKVRNVTVAVPPGTDQKLAMAQEVGSLTLVLRSSPDVKNHPNDPIYLADLEGAEELALVDKWGTAFSHLASSAKSVGTAIRDASQAALDEELKRLTRELEEARSGKQYAAVPSSKPMPSAVLAIRGNSQSYVIVKPKVK